MTEKSTIGRESQNPDVRRGSPREQARDRRAVIVQRPCWTSIRCECRARRSAAPSDASPREEGDRGWPRPVDRVLRGSLIRCRSFTNPRRRQMSVVDGSEAVEEAASRSRWSKVVRRRAAGATRTASPRFRWCHKRLYRSIDFRRNGDGIPASRSHRVRPEPLGPHRLLHYVMARSAISARRPGVAMR